MYLYYISISYYNIDVIYIYVYIWIKKTNNLFKITNISLLFRTLITLVKRLKRREIFVILNKLCVFFCFFNPYISSHTFKVGICLNIYIYIYIYIYYIIYIYIYIIYIHINLYIHIDP